jgi:hypothetical protein
MSTMHEIKCDPDPFELLRVGLKTAEFRENDRPYSTGDYLFLREFCRKKLEYSGRSLIARITNAFPLDEYGGVGKVMLSLHDIHVPTL